MQFNSVTEIRFSARLTLLLVACELVTKTVFGVITKTVVNYFQLGPEMENKCQLFETMRILHQVVINAEYEDNMIEMVVE
jgi:hypothetical protein